MGERGAPATLPLARHSNPVSPATSKRAPVLSRIQFLMVRTQLKPTVSSRSRSNRTLPSVLGYQLTSFMRPFDSLKKRKNLRRRNPLRRLTLAYGLVK